LLKSQARRWAVVSVLADDHALLDKLHSFPHSNQGYHLYFISNANDWIFDYWIISFSPLPEFMAICEEHGFISLSKMVTIESMTISFTPLSQHDKFITSTLFMKPNTNFLHHYLRSGDNRKVLSLLTMWEVPSDTTFHKSQESDKPSFVTAPPKNYSMI